MDAILYAPLAHLVLTHDPSLSSNPPEFYSNAALRAANVFFVDPETAMHPHLNFSQLLRGPGVQVCTYLFLFGNERVLSGSLVGQSDGCPGYALVAQSTHRGTPHACDGRMV
jgi:hypothetical protein